MTGLVNAEAAARTRWGKWPAIGGFAPAPGRVGVMVPMKIEYIAFAHDRARLPSRSADEDHAAAISDEALQSTRGAGKGRQKNTGDLQGKMRANYNASPCDGERKAAGAGTEANREKNRAQNNGNRRTSGRAQTHPL